jgi:hypothetical protein
MARPLIGWKRSATNNTGPDLQVTTVARSHRHPPISMRGAAQIFSRILLFSLFFGKPGSRRG